MIPVCAFFAVPDRFMRLEFRLFQTLGGGLRRLPVTRNCKIGTERKKFRFFSRGSLPNPLQFAFFYGII